MVLWVASCEDKVWQVPIEPGISWELASYRATKVSGVAYALTFDLPENPSTPIQASLDLVFVLAPNWDDIPLDFKGADSLVSTLQVNGNTVEIIGAKEHIILKKNCLNEGVNQVRITFTAGETGLNRKPQFIYSLLVPDRASTVFPCFDQPNLKARFSLQLEMPAHWDALANGSLEKAIPLPDTKRKKCYYKETAPISTYLFAFTAGEYQRITRIIDGQEVSMLYRESDGAKVRSNTDEIFALHQASIEWMEGYTGIQMPFEKLDFALIPDFQYGGMEHVGAIFYKEASLMLDNNATTNQKIRRASLIAHETAHLWFGDLVTMHWFSDVWLKEVFANFMAAKIVNPRFPSVNHDLNFLMSHQPSAYNEDRSQGSHPIQQPLVNLQEAGTLYGRIIYQKAPVVMNMLEHKMGDVPFRDGLRAYLQRFAYSNASWDDLIGLLDELTAEDLASWSNSWVKTYGMPVYAPSLRVDEDSTQYEWRFIQRNDRDKYWAQEATLALFYPDTLIKVTVSLEDERMAGKIVLDSLPLAVLANASARSYGYFPLDQASQDHFLHATPGIEDPFLRGAAWMALYEDFLHHTIDKHDMLGALLMAIPLENDPLNRDYILQVFQTIYWKFLTKEERVHYTEQVEQILYQAFTTALLPSEQLTYFRAFYQTALSDSAIAQLVTIWECDEIACLPLTETESTDLLAEIALRIPHQADSLIYLQWSHIRNPDRKDRFAFIAPALSGNPLKMDTFFNTIRLPENRVTEPWVVDGLSYLNHPLKADYSIKYLPDCLAMMQEIQATGDIFFPRQFITAALSGHQSKEAANTVRHFLSVQKDYPYRLRNKILMASDLLFRANL
ncbi:MAG: M1 family aminopeptidase [Saprospiraceae bacterium]